MTIIVGDLFGGVCMYCSASESGCDGDNVEAGQVHAGDGMSAYDPKWTSVGQGNCTCGPMPRPSIEEVLELGSYPAR